MTEVGKLVEALVKVRDKKSQAQRAFSEVYEKLTQIERNIMAKLLAHMNENGLDSLSTPHGRVSKRVVQKPFVTDWNEFYRYVLDNEAMHLLQKRVNQSAVREELEETGQLPPGVTLHQEYTISLRRN